MTAALKLLKPVPPPARPKSDEAELRALLRREVELTRKLAQVRARIGPAKRAYMVKRRCFGLSNEALLRELGKRP